MSKQNRSDAMICHELLVIYPGNKGGNTKLISCILYAVSHRQ